MKNRVPQSGLLDALPLILSRTSGELVGWDLLLILNDWADVPEVVALADLEEASFTGYARVGLDAAGWSAAVMEGSNAVSAWGTDPVVWICSGIPQRVTGQVILDPISNRVQKVDLFAEPIDLLPTGKISVVPRYALGPMVLE